jgi:hypothetical protein
MNTSEIGASEIGTGEVGIFKIDIEIPSEYPFKPPKVSLSRAPAAVYPYDYMRLIGTN